MELFFERKIVIKNAIRFSKNDLLIFLTTICDNDEHEEKTLINSNEYYNINNIIIVNINYFNKINIIFILLIKINIFF